MMSEGMHYATTIHLHRARHGECIDLSTPRADFIILGTLQDIMIFSPFSFKPLSHDPESAADLVPE